MFDCFKILGIDPDTNLTQEKLNRAYWKSITKSHPEKAPPDEVSQQKANEISQMINHARDILRQMFQNSSEEMND